MKLYYAPGACSLASHITLNEAGVNAELDKVDFSTRTTESGEAFASVNPLGYVPALRLDDGEVLTEGVAIMQFIADQHPDKGLAPAAGTIERVRLQSLMNFITAEVHKTYSPLFGPDTPEATKKTCHEKLANRYQHVEGLLADGRPFLTGDQFTVADAYLFTVTNWANFKDVDLSAFPNVLAFQKRVAERPPVQAALKAEGLLN